MKLNYGKLGENFKRGLFYFFQKDLTFEGAYTKLLRFSVLQIFLSITYLSSVIGYGVASGLGDWGIFAFISCASLVMLLLAAVNWKVIRNYQKCGVRRQDKGKKLLSLEAFLSFSTLPFCFLTKPKFLLNHYKNKKTKN